jgi:hypothetical protein
VKVREKVSKALPKKKKKGFEGTQKTTKIKNYEMGAWDRYFPLFFFSEVKLYR